jgi:hypothetical protein
MRSTRTLFFALFMFVAVNASADTIGTAGSYSVLGASTVTNTGSTVLHQDLGLSPGTSITGFPPGSVLGTIHDSDAAAALAQANALTGFNVLSGLAVTQTLTGQDLGGLSLDAGVYFYASSAQLTGPLTLDFQNLSNTMIVFQIGSTLTTASAASIVVINPGVNNQVYWIVGSSATLGTTTDFYGTIIASQSITLTTGADITCGRAIALTGAVTLDTNDIGGVCAGTVPTETPEPETLALVGGGLIAGTTGSSFLTGLGLTGFLAGVSRRIRR